jgi:xanthine dehydrogenase accessory factor
MDVFFEFVGTRQRLVVFGAGHVGEALVRVLDGASLEIVVADDRADWNSEARFPGRRRVLDLDEATRLALERPETTLACVMTYSHDIDFDIVCELAGAEPPPAFVGLIGSRTKAACFRTRFESRGLTGEQIGRIHCPIGVGDLGKTPLEVAISVAAQVLGVCRRLELDGAGGVAGERAGSETTWTVG